MTLGSLESVPTSLLIYHLSGCIDRDGVVTPSQYLENEPFPVQVDGIFVDFLPFINTYGVGGNWGQRVQRTQAEKYSLG